MKIRLLLCICALPTIHTYDHHKVEDNSKKLPERLLHLMRNYNDRAKLKINEITYIRSRYDATPHFECGYLVAEILESYRKMVGIAQHTVDYAIDYLFDVIKTAELLQKLFLEIYHLVNMFHEIVRKYSHMPEFHPEDEHSREALEDALKKIIENTKLREKEKKQKMKELKKKRELYAKGEFVAKPKKPNKPVNKWWPIDYGWEIDYQWW